MAIVSPIDGVVLSRDREVGDAVSSSLTMGSGATLIMTVGDLREVYVKGKADESADFDDSAGRRRLGGGAAAGHQGIAPGSDRGTKVRVRQSPERENVRRKQIAADERR